MSQSSPVWTADHAAELYRLQDWGEGYFVIDEAGRLCADVFRDGSARIALEQVVSRLRAEGTSLPLLVRFQDIIKTRVAQLNAAFDTARSEFGYQAAYRGVYPIKANQLHEVVDEILEAGRAFGMGLECGSKAELVAALPYLEDDTTLLIVNGYKDGDMLNLILMGQRLGKSILPVIEKPDECHRLLDRARQAGVSPRFGIRVRLNATGSGKWAESGGDLSKFGVSIPELLQLAVRLKRDGLEDSFRLLHFHLGSQVADIQAIREAVREITRIYAQLRRQGFSIEFVDVGGGLGINYEADLTMPSEGLNYTLQEYANAVVSTAGEICRLEDVPQPNLISESGRALSAHHSVLLVDVLSTYQKDGIADEFVPAPVDHDVVRSLHDTLVWVREDGPQRPAQLLEALHDATAKRREAESLFSFGYLPLDQKGLAEQLYWSTCRQINLLVARYGFEWLPSELEALDEHLVEQYLCDFSVFQSMLDHWAFGQRFPIMPIARLDEEPLRRGILVDLTCDSDGKIRRYVSSNDDKRYLDLHALREGQPYTLAFLLMGAYQDIMGDMHNLFGRVPEAHVYADSEEPEGFYVEKVIPGTSVEDILALVQYFPQDLRNRMEAMLMAEVRAGRVRRVEAVRLLGEYTRLFAGSTYLSTETGTSAAAPEDAVLATGQS